MTTMIAFCGLDCSRCGAYRATQADDDKLRATTAQEWSARYGVHIPPEQIVCDGCRADGRKFSYCESICELRKCGVRKGVDTCAACDECPCKALAALFEAAPEARENLEALRA